MVKKFCIRNIKKISGLLFSYIISELSKHLCSTVAGMGMPFVRLHLIDNYYQEKLAWLTLSRVESSA